MGCTCGPLAPGEYEADRASACFWRAHPNGVCTPTCGCVTTEQLLELKRQHMASEDD